jgi:hypothetical protein
VKERDPGEEKEGENSLVMDMAPAVLEFVQEGRGGCGRRVH